MSAAETFRAIERLVWEHEDAAAAWGQADGAKEPTASAIEAVRMRRRELLSAVGAALGVDAGALCAPEHPAVPGATPREGAEAGDGGARSGGRP